VNAAPILMRLLTIAGTIAMFLVGGGILTHGIPHAHEWIHHLADGIGATPSVGGLLKAITPTFIDAVVGIVAGGVTLVAVTLFQRMKGGAKSA
jgi:predicted DNA repair protein MutK